MLRTRVIKGFNAHARKERLSKNLFLKRIIQCALEKYQQENLFLYLEIQRFNELNKEQQ